MMATIIFMRSSLASGRQRRSSTIGHNASLTHVIRVSLTASHFGGGSIGAATKHTFCEHTKLGDPQSALVAQVCRQTACAPPAVVHVEPSGHGFVSLHRRVQISAFEQ
jgi:hypothetical protein